MIENQAKMKTLPVTFKQIFERWKWTPIRNCPGRFVFAGGRSPLTPAELAQTKIDYIKLSSDKIPDEILIAKLADGGLISYVKPDARFLHTLNTASGFERKLRQLEIDLPE